MKSPAVLLLLAATLPAGASDAVLPDYLPSETRAVFGIRVRSIVDLLDSQSFAGEWRGMGSRLMAQSPLAGFDPLKDLDEVLIASTGQGENPPVLIVLHGRFDVDRLASGRADYHGTPMIEDAKKAGAIAFLDASTAIAGDAPLVRAAIDRRGSGAGVDASLAARIEPLRSRYGIWGIGDRLNELPSKTKEHGAMDSLDQFEVGVDLAQGLELTAKLHVRSPEDAEKLASALALAGTMLKGGQASSTNTKVDMHTENGWLTLSLKVPPDELNKAIQEQRASLQSALVSRLGVPPVPAAAAPAPAKSPAAPPAAKVVRDPTGDTRMLTLPGKR
jgi:hypothetical protein